jgi:hypothetical protein
VEVTERELSPDTDFEMIDGMGSGDASLPQVELAQQGVQDPAVENEPEGRTSGWVFGLFGRRREGSDDH